MDKIKIIGGNRLNGQIYISGAKNAALPLICASLLTDETVTLTNMPMLSDIRSMNALLEQMGTQIPDAKILQFDCPLRLCTQDARLLLCFGAGFGTGRTC